MRFLYVVMSIGVLLITTASCRGGGRVPTVSVCELFQNLQKWDGQVVRVMGLARVTTSPYPRFFVMTPISPESCMFMGEEPAEIGLQLPGDDFRHNAPATYQYDAKSVQQAERELKGMLQKNSNLQQVKITVEGAVSVRRYRRSDNTRGPIGVIPEHIPFPITITVQSYKDLEQASPSLRE